MRQLRQIRIFLSSPSDVAQERTLAHQVIDTLNHDPLLRDRVVLKAISWDRQDSRTPMLATMTPQEAINQGLPKPSECDIVIVILWARMGTPLPAKYTKPDGSRYNSGTEYEYLDAVNASKGSKEQPVRPQVIIYRSTRDVALNPKESEFTQKYEQWQRVEDFFAQFHAPDGSIIGGVNDYKKPDDFRADFENDVKVLVNRLLETPSPAAQSALAPIEMKFPARWQGSPFPGLRAFTPDDGPIFFGRGRETDDLIARFADPKCRFMCVVGASGSGKSSLVGAGLIPRLLANALEGSKDWVWMQLTPGGVGDNPFMSLAAGLMTNAPSLKRKYLQPRQLSEFLENRPEQFDTILSLVLQEQPAWSELILFIDQFEEIFTLVSERHRMSFIDLIVNATQLQRIRIIVTLRADFYYRCVEVGSLAELLRTASYPLAAPKITALHEMIARPAERIALMFESGLLDRILDDTGSDPGALALLAFALDELYRTAKEQGLVTLTHQAYDVLGGVQGAIGTRAGIVFDSLDLETQSALPDVFRNLVEVDERGVATRQRVAFNRIIGGNNSAAEKLVDALTSARLLVKGQGENNQPIVEVAHEALLREWDHLATWIENAQDDLRLLRQVKLAAAEWEHADRSKVYLWQHERLESVYQMMNRLKPDFDTLTQDFIKPEFDRLLEELEDINTLHSRRVQIGERLAEIGDNRPGVGLASNGTPDIVWLDVPRGAILMWNQENKTTEEIEVKPFRIAKYPITFLQYRTFLDDPDGYRNRVWWDELEYKKQQVPQYRSINNHPADRINWHAAVAFCRWLSSKFNESIRLPTDWEWQHAATGGQLGKKYPWGDTWDTRKLNTRESGLSRTTAVGMYPHGKQLELGVFDLGGNIWEWCLNDYKSLHVRIPSPDYGVLCGGSWFNHRGYARITHNLKANRDVGQYNYGFRVVSVSNATK